MQLYMSWYIRSFFSFTFLNILYFFKYACTNIFHRRSFILSIRVIVSNHLFFYWSQIYFHSSDHHILLCYVSSWMIYGSSMHNIIRLVKENTLPYAWVYIVSHRKTWRNGHRSPLHADSIIQLPRLIFILQLAEVYIKARSDCDQTQLNLQLINGAVLLHNRKGSPL